MRDENHPFRKGTTCEIVVVDDTKMVHQPRFGKCRVMRDLAC